MNKIIGMIFPVPLQFVDRLFVAHRNVFVKYTRTTSLKLIPKHKVLFYASHDSKEVVGEGIIEKMEFLTPTEALEKYGDKVFLNKDELAYYTTQQPGRPSGKKMLTLVLTKLRRYSCGIKYERPITMTGEYLTEEKHSGLLQKVFKEEL